MTLIHSATGTKTAGTTRSPSPDSPAVNAVGTTSKSGDNTGTIQCRHCKKQFTTQEHDSHLPACLEKKKEKARKKKEAKEAKVREAKARELAEEKDRDGDSVMGDNTQATGPAADGTAEDHAGGSTKIQPKKSASKNSKDKGPESKKRKADTEADKEPKKKKLKKDELPKPKLPKPKGPVNVEQQCGVLLPNGGFCARSLTCKSHSMGSKRSVPGRSLPYDQLLAMYQKRNQAKMQKAALSAAAPLPDDEPPTGPIDSDEETEKMMLSLRHWHPKPLIEPERVPIKTKYQTIRRKEMLAEAMANNGGKSLFGVPTGPKEASLGGQEGMMLPELNLEVNPADPMGQFNRMVDKENAKNAAWNPVRAKASAGQGPVRKTSGASQGGQ